MVCFQWTVKTKLVIKSMIQTAWCQLETKSSWQRLQFAGPNLSNRLIGIMTKKLSMHIFFERVDV